MRDQGHVEVEPRVLHSSLWQAGVMQAAFEACQAALAPRQTNSRSRVQGQQQGQPQTQGDNGYSAGSGGSSGGGDLTAGHKSLLQLYFGLLVLRKAARALVDHGVR